MVRWSVCLTVVLLSGVSTSTAAQEEREPVRFFHRGRLYNGNLGEPARTNLRRDENAVLEEYFDQQLDHFTPVDTRMWKQRFFTNAEYFKKDGPAFLMIGGEGTASKEWMFQGEWIETAKEFHAVCFQLEHRFYGKSHPMPDLSDKSLVYLNSEQALADLAFFIQAMNKRYKLPSETKWVVFGGSYPGSLAAWMRVQYPHLVYAAMSASGPLVAKLDFDEYFVVVRDAIGKTSQTCLKAISDGTEQIKSLLQHSAGQSQLNEIFRLCDPIDTSNNADVANLYETLSGNFAGVVQYNKDNRMTNSSMAKVTIDTLCDIMVNNSIGSPVQRLAAVNTLILDATKTKCLDYTYRNFLTTYRNTSLNATSAEGGRQWTWQTCVEFGFYQTSTKVPELFGDDFPVDFFTKQCKDIFGAQFTKKYQQQAVDRTNTIYGGLHLQASRVVYVHGSIDPWHALGMLKTLLPDAPAIYIEGTAHCANMYPRSPKDPVQLIKARQMVRRYLRLWLRNSDSKSNASVRDI